MMKEDEIEDFFNLYIESVPTTQSGDFIKVTLIACQKKDIYKYFDFVKNNQLGYKPFGNLQVDVVVPRVFYVFDFMKTGLPSSKRNKEGYADEVRIRHKRISDYLRVFREMGDDVTATFNINLEEILSGQNESETTTTVTATTTQIPEDSETENVTLEAESITTGEPNIDNVELEVEIKPIFPREFSNGIIDNSNNPAFNVKKVAKVFADHIKNLKDESGQMVGVFGQWGRGKSYFINEVFKIYGSRESSPFMIIKFQAWKYQNTQSIWAYLYETFIEVYLNVNLWNKWTRIFCLSINRNGHWKTWIWPLIGILIGVFAFSFTSTLTEDSERQLIIKIAGFVATLAISIDRGSSIMKKIKNPATSIFNSFSKAPSFKEVLGVQAEIQKELKSLIKAWSKKFNNKRILLFVDDLDRCSENQIIEIIDSLRVILDDELITKHILILVALDEKKLEKAISKKYENLFSQEELPGIVAEYMDKLFISAIKLFPISFDERAEFVEKLAKQINLEDNPEEELTKESKPNTKPTPTSVSDSIAETGVSQDSGQVTATVSTPSPTPTPAPEVQKSSKNLEEVEVTMLQEKIKLANKELTPRQIRILIYRYLLARNLWLIYFREIDWKAGDAIDAIMRFSGFSKKDPKSETKINPGLSNIVRMVVAY